MVDLERRHSRWYESCLLSEASQLLIGALLVLVVPTALLWGTDFRQLLGAPQWTALVAVELAFLVSSVAHFSDC